MKKLPKWLSVLLAATMAGTMLVGCGGSEPEAEAGADTASETSTEVADNIVAATSGTAVTEGEADNELSIAWNAAPPTLDIHKTSAVVARQIAYGNIYEALMTEKEDYTPTCELAESFDVNEDYTEYVYHLRQGVLFHNGEEMKADDVVASMNRWIESYGNAATMVGDSRFEKVDDYTVKISFTTPCMYLNDLIAGAGQMPAIIPASTIETEDPDTGYLTEYIGTGPFRFDEWVQDQYIKLSKFEDYQPYGEEGYQDGFAGYKVAYVDTVYNYFATDDASRVAGMQSGEYDIAYSLPIDNYAQFEGKEDYIIYNEMTGATCLIYNKQEGLSANKTFRQAINAALNQEEIMMAGVPNPEFYRLDSSYMYKEQKTWYSDAGSEYYNQNDPEKAKELLAEAGYNGETFTLLVSSDYTEFYNDAVVIQNELQAIGVDCELLVGDWATFLSYRSDPSAYDAFITSFTPIATPTMNLYLTQTWPGWETDATVVEALDKINSATDAAEAYKEWEALQEYCWSEELPVSKFGDRYVYSVSTNKVEKLGYFQGPYFWNTKVYK